MIQLVVLGLLFSAVVIDARPPSAPFNAAAEARRLVHQANWASVGSLSTTVEGYPMVSVLSTADSKVGAASTGDIFFYLLRMDLVALDTKVKNKVTFMFTDAQEGECNKQNIDPYSHACPRAMISGDVQEVEEGTPEHDRGLEAFLSRHPTAVNWNSMPSGHKFYLCKLNINNVLVFGNRGYKTATPAEYFTGTDSLPA